MIPIEPFGLQPLQPLRPFEPILCDKGPTGEQWTAQIKWDGVRMLAYFDGRETRLVNRKLGDRTLQYPEFHRPQEYCKAGSFILDGEMIAFDERKPSFREVMRRDGQRRSDGIAAAVRAVPVVYMIFDIVYCDGSWVGDRTLADRQRLLEDVVVPGPYAQLVGNFPDGDALFEAMRAQRMEGVVYKDLTSVYTPGAKDGRWRKRKLVRDLYAVVGGATYRDGAVNALLLGLYAPSGELVYIGHTGPGKLPQAEWAEWTRKVESLRTSARPFANQPVLRRDTVWTVPRLAAKVHYMEWTEGGIMRQPVLQTLVDPADPAVCTMEQIE